MPTGIDIDNTIAVTDIAVIQHLNRRFGVRYSREHLHDCEIERALRLPPEHAAFVRELFADERFYLELPVLRRAVEGVSFIAETDEVVYMTARPMRFADATMRWLSDNGFPVGEVVCGVDDKGEVAVDYGCEACVEDDPRQVARIVARQIPTFVVLCPWNRDLAHPLVTKVRGWGEIISILQEE